MSAEISVCKIKQYIGNNINLKNRIKDDMLAVCFFDLYNQKKKKKTKRIMEDIAKIKSTKNDFSS